ncbi:DUF6069 family protein [Nocardia sp. NPDC051570]|uniref:DUF6069 family protein n=1 Tax=Nocardia sp. NPDC051570 TaxID=3364324 RepID=UPI0037ACEEC2
MRSVQAVSVQAVSTATARIPAVSRPVAVLGGTAMAVIVNLAICLIGNLAGGSYEITDASGNVSAVAPGGVLILSAVPLLVGTTAAVLLSYRWIAILRIAEITGSVLALATIGFTVTADFDTASTIALSLMHITLVPVLVVALEGVRRSIEE